MKHYVKNGFRTPSDDGQILDYLYGWNMSDTQELVYDDEEKTLIMYDDNEVLWKETNYSPDKNIEDYMKNECM